MRIYHELYRNTEITVHCPQEGYVRIGVENEQENFVLEGGTIQMKHILQRIMEELDKHIPAPKVALHD